MDRGKLRRAYDLIDAGQQLMRTAFINHDHAIQTNKVVRDANNGCVEAKEAISYLVNDPVTDLGL